MAEVVPGVHRVDGLAGGPRAANVYLLVDDVLALVDAGLPGNLNGIARYVASLGRGLEDLRFILLTHAHPDHTGGAPALREKTGARVLAHRGDVQAGKNGPSVAYLRVFGSSPLPLPFLRRVPADGLLEDGDELPILGGLRVHATPGHTPGSVCFELKERGALFCDDLIVEGRGRLGKNQAYPGSDLAAYRASLERIASLDYEVLCPGHGAAVTQQAAQRVRGLVRQAGPYGLTWRLLG
ncbi:MAG: MBL fold metallo-hydrolase [Chloroflexi bacterium]|nr:MBL fold metallo-hydrolase [Chloroflexota bacterium]